MPTSPLIEVQNLFYGYPDGTQALSGVSFSLDRGERLAIIGANGSGKSTLLLHLAGCLAASQGKILLSGDISNLKQLRKAVGMIFQEPDDQLFMPSVLEDVAFGLVSRGMEAASAQERAMTALESLSAAHLANRPPHRLSGGEKRLVALAGILVIEPEIIVLDEPTAALDPRARRRVIEVLRALDQTMILATHDIDMAMSVCTSVLIMNEGRFAAAGELPGLLKDEAFLRANGL